MCVRVHVYVFIYSFTLETGRATLWFLDYVVLLCCSVNPIFYICTMSTILNALQDKCDSHCLIVCIVIWKVYIICVLFSILKCFHYICMFTTKNFKFVVGSEILCIVEGKVLLLTINCMDFMTIKLMVVIERNVYLKKFS